jgi:hypothetical protein
MSGSSSSSSSSTTSLLVILLVLGGGVSMLKQYLEPQPKAAAEQEAEAVSELSAARRALDFSQTNGDAMNNSMNDQLKSVQQMTGGTYDGQTYVLPGNKR